MMNDSSDTMARRAGLAAALAFLDIALCGYLAYMVLLVVRAPLEIIRRADVLVALAAPTAFAALAYCPTDALTRVLGRAARVASLAGIVACVYAAVRILSGSSSAGVLAIDISVGTSLLGGLIAGAHFAAFFRCSLTNPHPSGEKSQLSGWQRPTFCLLYAIGVAACAVALASLPVEPLLAGGASGKEFLQKRFTEFWPLALAETATFLAIIAGIPLLIVSLLSAQVPSGASVWLLPILGAFWLVLSIRWAENVPGLGVLACSVCVVMATAALVGRRYLPSIGRTKLPRE